MPSFFQNRDGFLNYQEFATEFGLPNAKRQDPAAKLRRIKKQQPAVGSGKGRAGILGGLAILANSKKGTQGGAHEVDTPASCVCVCCVKSRCHDVFFNGSLSRI